MDNTIRKTIIFMAPMSMAEKTLHDTIVEQNEAPPPKEDNGETIEKFDIFLLDDLKELNQFIGSSGQSLIVFSNLKKCATFLQESKNAIAKNKSKILLFSMDEIPTKISGKLNQSGLSEIILESTNQKSILYKVRLLLKAIKAQAPAIQKKDQVIKSMLDLNFSSNIKKEKIGDDTKKVNLNIEAATKDNLTADLSFNTDSHLNSQIKNQDQFNLNIEAAPDKNKNKSAALDIDKNEVDEQVRSEIDSLMNSIKNKKNQNIDIALGVSDPNFIRSNGPKLDSKKDEGDEFGIATINLIDTVHKNKKIDLNFDDELNLSSKKDKQDDNLDLQAANNRIKNYDKTKSLNLNENQNDNNKIKNLNLDSEKEKGFKHDNENEESIQLRKLNNSKLEINPSSRSHLDKTFDDNQNKISSQDDLTKLKLQSSNEKNNPTNKLNLSDADKKEKSGLVSGDQIHHLNSKVKSLNIDETNNNKNKNEPSSLSDNLKNKNHNHLDLENSSSINNEYLHDTKDELAIARKNKELKLQEQNKKKDTTQNELENKKNKINNTHLNIEKTKKDDDHIDLNDAKLTAEILIELKNAKAKKKIDDDLLSIAKNNRLKPAEEDYKNASGVDDADRASESNQDLNKVFAVPTFGINSLIDMQIRYDEGNFEALDTDILKIIATNINNDFLGLTIFYKIENKNLSELYSFLRSDHADKFTQKDIHWWEKEFSKVENKEFYLGHDLPTFIIKNRLSNNHKILYWESSTIKNKLPIIERQEILECLFPFYDDNNQLVGIACSFFPQGFKNEWEHPLLFNLELARGLFLKDKKEHYSNSSSSQSTDKNFITNILEKFSSIWPFNKRKVV